MIKRVLTSFFENKKIIKIFSIVFVLVFLSIYTSFSNTNILRNFLSLKTFKYSIKEELTTLKKTVYSDVTVISIYLSLKKTKHSKNEYTIWVSNLIKSLSSPLAIVVDSTTYQEIKELKNSVTIKFYVVDSIWSILKQCELERNQNYLFNYLNNQNKIDPEKHIHNPDLYAIWNLKSYISYKIAEENPFGSKFFIYTDAGAWRDKIIPDWPDQKFILEELLPYVHNRTIFGQIAKVHKFNELNNIIEGTFFAGSYIAFRNFYNYFFDIHDDRLNKNLFIGKDQTHMNILAFKYFKESVVKLELFEYNNFIHYNTWFVYQIYFSNNSNLECQKKRLSFLKF